MKRISFFVILWALFHCAAAMAVVDSRPDRIGVYFDPDANRGNILVGQDTPFNVYVIIINPSDTVISGFEFGYQFSGFGLSGLIRLSNDLPPGATDTGDNSGILEGDYSVLLDTPLPVAPAVVVTTWHLMYRGILEAFITLKASDDPTLNDGFPAYFGESSVNSLAYSFWACGVERGGAVINETCPTATEAAGFGSVKSLFR
ncbi:MAG: hypothetical protein ABFS42_12710 [Candidatus Krumholzibacteriota bacterium]